MYSFNINPKILCNLITEDFNYSKGNINLFYRYRFKFCLNFYKDRTN